LALVGSNFLGNSWMKWELAILETTALLTRSAI
jgi:hypothetical protein